MSIKKGGGWRQLTIVVEERGHIHQRRCTEANGLYTTHIFFSNEAFSKSDREHNCLFLAIEVIFFVTLTDHVI